MARLQHHGFDGNGTPSAVTRLPDLAAGPTELRTALTTVQSRLDLQQSDDTEIRRARIAGRSALITAGPCVVASVLPL